MPGEYVIPPWFNQPNPVDTYARGIQIGSQIGQQQAAQVLQQEAAARAEQKAQMEGEVDKAKIFLAADEQARKVADVARKYAAQKQYQDLLDQGTPPDQALLKVGPSMGASAEAMTAALRLPVQREQTQSLQDYRQSEIQNTIDRLTEQKRHNLQQEEDSGKAKDYGEIQTIDLGGGYRAAFRKGSPGLHVMSPQGEKDLTVTAAANLLSKIPAIDEAAGTAGTTNSLSQTLAPSLMDKIKSVAAKNKIPKETAAPPPLVTTKKDFDALSSGDLYTGKDGRVYRKP